MNYRPITEDYAAAAQISVDDVARIKALGYKSVICNRPDGEDPGQTDAETIRKAVEAAGMEFLWIPTISGRLTAENVEDQANALEALPSPVFAYCRSGARCTNLFLMAQQAKA